MNKLTGNKQTDFIVLMNLNDQELGKVCKVNKYVNSLCADPHFWFNRIIIFFALNSEEVKKLQSYLDIKNNRDFYIYLRSLESIRLTPNRVEDVRKYLPDVLRYMIEQTIPEAIINEYLRDDTPKWFNREEIVYEMRRNFPEVIMSQHFNKAEKKFYGILMSSTINISKRGYKTNFRDLLKD